MATYTVAQLARAVSQLLTRHFQVVQVEGEVGAFTASSQKHWYFNLKDDTSQIRCVFFKNRNQFAPFTPREGDKILLYATLDWYAPRGDVQLIVESIQKVGQGNLHEQFLRTKQELETLGWFDADRKRDLPRFVRRVGLITSAEGAVLHDVITTLERRAPFIQITVYPCLVQGIEAVSAIVAQIGVANARKECEVLVLCRGGGALEDLAAFNTREVAQAIYDSTLPLISAVGHETDYTIADFVADLRAPTPTAAAELLSMSVIELETQLQSQLGRLAQAMHTRLRHESQRFDYAQKSHRQMRLAFERLLHEAGGALKALSVGIKNKASMHTSELRQEAKIIQESVQLAKQQQVYLLAHRVERLSEKMKIGLAHKQQRLEYTHQALAKIDVAANLKMGYAIVRTAEQQIVRSAEAMRVDEVYEVTLVDGKRTIKTLWSAPS